MMQQVAVLFPIRVGRWMLAVGGLLLIALFVLWAFFLRGERAYLVDADTQGMTVTFDRSAASSWRLTDVTICRRIARGESGAEAGAARYCDGRLFSERKLATLEIEWPPATRIDVQRNRADGALLVRIAATGDRLPDTPGGPLPAGSLIFVTADGWTEAGALTFSGQATIGAVPGPGSRDLLISGRYEIREELAGRRDRLVAVKEGSLFAGDSVTLVGPGEDRGAAVAGYLLRRQSGDQRSGFRVTLFSAHDDVRLKVARLNVDKPAILTASWTDRALRDPWLIGLTALLGFVSTVTGLVSRFWPSRG